MTDTPAWFQSLLMSSQRLESGPSSRDGAQVRARAPWARMWNEQAASDRVQRSSLR